MDVALISATFGQTYRAGIRGGPYSSQANPRLLAPNAGTRPTMLRVLKLPVVAGACLIAGILLGTALTPVLAQRMSGPDGQVAVRSDYAVYLITGGQRRWVATVMITDQEINAIPE